MAGTLIHQTTASILAAGQRTPLAGDPVERPGFDAYCLAGVNGSAAGIVAVIMVGGVVEADNLQVNALNRFPVLPDDLILVNSLCPMGALNRVLLRNPTIGTLTDFTFFRAQIERFGSR